MRRAIALTAFLLFALSSCGASLRLSATAPVLDNDGTCASPVLSQSPAGGLRKVYFSWAGPVTGQDSVATVVGGLATITVAVPPGLYTCRAWAWGPGGIGCDTTITRLVTAPPWRVAFQ